MPDIREKISLMVQNNASHEDIMKVINDFNGYSNQNIKTTTITENKLGSKNNPIQGIPSVKDAKLGLYYQNKNTNQLYVFADNKYHEIDPAKTYDNAPVNKERPFGTYFTQTEVDLYSVSRAADNKQIQDQTVLPGYMFNQKAADEGVLFDGFKFPEANYRYKEENGRAAWSKSTDGDKNFEVVDATNIPESWLKDPQFKLALAGQKGAAIIDGVAYNNFQEYRDREGNTKLDKFEGTAFHPLQYFRSDERKDEETHVTNLEDDEENYAKAMNISASDLKKNKSFYSDLPENRGFFADLASSWKQGYGSGSSSNESWEVFKKGDGISSEDLKALIATNKKIEELGNTNEQVKFAKDLEKYGGGVFGTLRAFAENPGFAPQAIVSSIGTMAGSFVDSEEVWGTALASAGAGAVVGAGIGSLGFSLGPFGVLTTAGGAITGTVSGFIGGLVGSMETGLTLTDLLKDELDGAQFNEENVIRILENKDVLDKIKARAYERGITIGAFEAVTAGLSRGIASSMIRSSREVGETGIKTGLKISASTTALEMAGGASGEYAGQLAQYRGEGLKSSGKKVNISDVVVEGLIEAKGVVNVVDVISESLKNSEYTINGEKRTKKEIRDLINNPNTPIESLAKINFEIKNDDEFNNFVNKKQNDAILDSQIDSKVTDKEDRKTLVELESNRLKAEFDLKKKGISKVPNAPEVLATIEAEIDAIIGKYDGAKGMGETESAQSTANVVRENRISRTIAFAETEGKKIGKSVKVVDNNNEAQAAYDKMAAEGNLVAKDVTGADGYIVGDVIIINKEVAGLTGAINVGGHEILHGIFAKHMQGLDLAGKKELISSFKSVLSKNQLAAVTERLQENYSDQIAEDSDFINTTDEWFTAFSDAIEQGDITFDEGVFSQLKNTIQEVLRKFGIKKDFSNGRQAYNFLKDYSKSIEKNQLSSRALTLANSGTTITEERKRKELEASTQKDKTVPGERKVNHTNTDSKGNTYTYFANTTDKGGVTTTKFKFNRSDEASTQRNAGGVPTQVALGDKYTIDPQDQLEGAEITQVLEIRESETGASATVRYQDADGNEFNGEVVLVPTTGKKADSKFSKSASDEVQRIYDEKGNAGVFDIIEQFKPIVNKIVQKRSEAPGFDRELLTSEIEIGKRGILDLVREYDPKSGVPLAAFINKYLPARAIEASRRILGEEFMDDVDTMVDVASEEVSTETEVKPERKNIIIAEKLNVVNEVSEAIKKIMPTLDLNDLTFKALKNQIPEVIGEMFGITPNKLISSANITKKELQSAQMFINKNADLLLSILPEGATTGGTATGVPKTLLDAFYVKADRAKMAKTGSKAGLAIQVKKGNISNKEFLEVFGIIDGKPIRNDRNISARVLSIANLTGKMITNQAVRQYIISEGKTTGEVAFISDGKAKVMFSSSGKKKVTIINKSKGEELAEKIGKKASYDNMVKAAGLNIDTSEFDLEPIDLSKESGREEYLGFIEEKLVPKLSKEVLLAMSGSFARGDSKIEKANKNKFLFKNKEEFEIFLETLEARGVVFGELTPKQETDILNAVGREIYGKSTSKTQVQKMTAKEKKASKKAGFRNIWEIIQETIQDDQRAIPGFALLLSSSSRFQGHFTRTGAVIDFINTLTGKNIEEHTSPITGLNKYLFLHAIIGDLFTDGKNSVFEKATKYYFQGSLPIFMDNRLKKKDSNGNIIYDYSSLPPIELLEGILNGSISIWARYFHPNVNSNFDTDVSSMSEQDIANGEHKIGGINPNVIVLANGKTIAQEFGVDVKTKITPEIVAAQQSLIYRISIGEVISTSKIKSILNNATNISSSIKDNTTVSVAYKFSRTVNPAKGISVLDFDDTLATTKSGVRYTLPNPDGTPQPKKKVIFMAGGPGSGKSNVINQLGLKEQGFKVVNQDISLEWLMKNHGMPTDMREFTPEQASEFGKLNAQAREIALKKRIKYQGEGDGVIIDGTGASLNVMKKNIQDFKDKGYDVQMIFVDTSQETALSRNKARKERSLRTGIVIKTHDSVQANKEAYKELFGERFAEVNTDNLKQGDVMPADVVNKVNDFTSGYIKGRLNAGEYATKGEELKQQGAEFDFSEFNQVVEGKTAPLFNKAMKLQEKFTSKDMFVLTARPAESTQAIFEFLQANGLKIPMENIIGLGSSASADKAFWMAGKVGEGYNDFYFADDILENVQAVSDMLDQFDVKSKVQQAKRDFVLGDPKVTKLLDEKSMSDVKDVDRLANPGVYSNVKFSKSHRAEYENTVAKNRPDLSGKEVTATIDKMFEYIDGLDVPNKRKYEQITTKWLATSNIKLPEDSYKIQQAVEIAELKKEDIFSYKNPNEIIEKYAGTIKVKPISPVGIKEFTKATGLNDPITKEYGIVEYEVEETGEAQQKVRDIVNTHWGPNSNPWCITKIDKDGNLSEDAWRDWTSYGKGPKRIVFQNGKLLAMKANYEYWGKMNKHSEGPIIQVKEGNVTNTTELVVGDGGIVDPIIRETRTVSKDGNTVTTNIFENSQDGYAEGTTIVENRIKGVKTKETRFDPDGSKVNTQEFNKKGKPTTSYQFNPNGTVNGINGHLQQQAITEAGLDVNAREDADIDLTNELVVKVGDIVENNYAEKDLETGVVTDYFYGRALVGDQVMEIGFESKTGLDLADVTKNVDGKTRLDIGKILREVDPDVKGLPKTGVKFSKGASREFNDIIEQSTGVGSEKVFSDAQAKIRGNKRRFDNIVPYSVQDLMGLLYNFVGRGKAGEQHMEFFKKALIDPFARAINELNQSRQSSAGDYSNLTKAFPNVKKKLNKEIEGGDYTYDQAVRVYLWNKAGFEVPGLSKRDLNALDSIVKNDPELQAFADTLGLISKKEEGYGKPSEYWLVENIASDLLSDGSIGDARSEFLAEWQQNADEMFSKENLNKIEAIYGSKFREALEDILYRMKNGTNRPTGSNRLTNNFMNWINNSTGAIMFFNMRSALLQTLSTTNYINWADNNPLKAAMAFANQKQYWSDFAALFNSDFLKQRRSGNQRSVNEAELTAAVANSDNKAKAAIAWLLQKGFLPTQIMDSFAISAGGATFYRNRINKYIKEGMTKEEAQEKAFLDFQEVTEATQQSARPDMISQQQASPLGRLILSFQNTPMQYARIMNKAARDIVNGRGDQKSNISKIVYYGALQSIIFAALQSAIFAALGDDEEEEFDKKKQRIVDSMVDGWLAGLGVAGKAIGTIERSIKEYLKQKERGFNADHAQTIIQLLGFSPPIGSKVRKIYGAIQTEQFNKGVSERRGLTLDNPTWSSWGNVIEGFTNIPLGRIANKMLNIDNALDSQNQWWERAALLLGWNTWDLGIKDPDIEAVRGEIKKEKKIEQKRIRKEKVRIKKEEKDKKLEKENADKEKANLELQKKEREAGKKVICAAVSTKGERCKKKIERGSTYCTIHDKVEQNESGKKSQCKKVKNDGKKCKIKTTNKSGYCYYHD